MEDSLKYLLKTPLFSGLTEETAERLLSELAIRRRQYDRDEVILQAGGTVTGFGIVLSGAARLEREDAYGNREILGSVRPGELFAEVFACLGDVPLQVAVLADAPCEVLFLKIDGLFRPEFTQVLHRFLRIMAQKNYLLTEKLRHVSKRSTREKLLSYLDAERRRAGTRIFTIPFDRQQLADYLAIDRSAMCRELGRMKAEGLIDYDRKTFRLMTNSD